MKTGMDNPVHVEVQVIEFQAVRVRSRNVNWYRDAIRALPRLLFYDVDYGPRVPICKPPVKRRDSHGRRCVPSGPVRSGSKEDEWIVREKKLGLWREKGEPRDRSLRENVRHQVNLGRKYPSRRCRLGGALRSCGLFGCIYNFILVFLNSILDFNFEEYTLYNIIYCILINIFIFLIK